MDCSLCGLDESLNTRYLEESLIMDISYSAHGLSKEVYSLGSKGGEWSRRTGAKAKEDTYYPYSERLEKNTTLPYSGATFSFPEDPLTSQVSGGKHTSQIHQMSHSLYFSPPLELMWGLFHGNPYEDPFSQSPYPLISPKERMVVLEEKHMYHHYSRSTFTRAGWHFVICCWNIFWWKKNFLDHKLVAEELFNYFQEYIFLTKSTFNAKPRNPKLELF